jgi:hypothetical protein
MWLMERDDWETRFEKRHEAGFRAFEYDFRQAGIRDSSVGKFLKSREFRRRMDGDRIHPRKVGAKMLVVLREKFLGGAPASPEAVAYATTYARISAEMAARRKEKGRLDFGSRVPEKKVPGTFCLRKSEREAET